MHCASDGPPSTFHGVVSDAFCQNWMVRQASSSGAGPGPAVMIASYFAQSGRASCTITRRSRCAATTSSPRIRIAASERPRKSSPKSSGFARSPFSCTA